MRVKIIKETELDSEFERIEDINREYQNMLSDLADMKSDLLELEKEIEEFREEHKDDLIN